MSGVTVGIAGAGLLGRLLAWQLAHAGCEVSVFDPAPGPQPFFGGNGQVDATPSERPCHAAGFSAAGMLSPLAELENAPPSIAALGWRSIALWRDITHRLAQRPAFEECGSLMLAHRHDIGAAQRVLARLATPGASGPQARALDAGELAAIEPSLQAVAHAWLLPGEAHIDTVHTMQAMHAEAPSVAWHWSRPVIELAPHRLMLSDGDSRRFDIVFDVRGVGARPALPVRGVRGELVWLGLPRHGLTRPVRLLHPRQRVYLEPRSADLVVLGASEIESEDRSPPSLRTAVELMSAAHSVMPSLAEARIVNLDSNLRPALPDNAPRIDATHGLVRINGLFRHGWLLAPALVDDALTACGIAPRELETT